MFVQIYKIRFFFYLDSFLSPCGGINSEENSQQTETPMDLDVTPLVLSNPQQEQNFHCERVPFEEPREWCHISYYEMSNRVGEQFRATQSQVIIDGFTHPSNAERFCLGGLTNVQRTEDIDKARRYIGRGVKLFHIRGNVFAECISDNPVFVQSPITNRRLSWHPATVCKIPPSKFSIYF
jgi:MAD (mothers against decapentaplegic) family protein 2/3